MNDDNSKRRLGRGLAALIGEMDQLPAADVGSQSTVNPDRLVPIEFVGRNPRNPRRYFDESELQDLASSIRQHGIVQPVVVRTIADNRFEIIAGERRWRAAQLAGLTDIPVIIRDVDDRTALEIAIVENVQRSDLNPLEEAMGYELLIADHGYTQYDLGEIIGKSRSHVANSLRLLKLPEPVRDAERIAQNDIKAQVDPTPVQGRKEEKDTDTLALERTLSDVLGLDVTVNHKGNGGQLRIAYKTLEQLEEICRLLERR